MEKEHSHRYASFKSENIILSPLIFYPIFDSVFPYSRNPLKPVIIEKNRKQNLWKPSSLKKDFMRQFWDCIYHIYGGIILFLVTGSTMQVFAQDSHLTFTNYTINDGLSDGLVNCVTQDHQGFMWFGTGDGLDRFDGYEFKDFYHYPFDTSSLSDNSITALFTDSRGQMWVGTLNGGLNLFDRVHNRFIHLLANTKKSSTSANSYIKTITEDKKGDLWLSSSNDGIFEFVFPKDKKGKLQLPEKIIHYNYHAGDKDGLDHNLINNIYIDHEDRLWVSTGDRSLQVADLNKNTVHFTTPSFTVLQPKMAITKTGINYDMNQLKNRGNQPGNNQLVSFHEDRHHNLFIGGVGVFFILKHNSDTLIRYPIVLLPGLQNPTIYSIRQEPPSSKGSDTYWLATWNGIFIFNTKESSLQLVPNQPGNKENMLSGVILHIYNDNSECIWLCTNGYGLSKYDPHANLFSTYTFYSEKKDTQSNNLSVLSILDIKDYLLLGSYYGLFSINKNNNVLSKVNSPEIIDNMTAADSGKVWMAGMGGLILYNLNNKKQAGYYSPGISAGGIKDNRIIKIYNDYKGGLWLLTTHSFSYFSLTTKTFENYFYRKGALNTIYFPFHGDIYRDLKGNFWLGTEIGFLSFNTQKKTFHYYVNNPQDTSSISFNVAECVAPDPKQPDKYLWIGTAGGGLNKFNLQTKKFIHFTTKDGLPDNTINGMLSDNKGFLWISTNKGLSKFNPSNNIFHNYDIHDGLTTNEFNPGAYYKNAAGKFFFGSAKGFTSFYPDSIKNSSYIPNIVFTDFRLFNQPISVDGKNSPLKQSLSETHLITLPHDENMISFKVAALDYSEPYKNQYAYRLMGGSNRWINLGTDRQITLENLAPGNYTLQVTASNSDGIWNEKGVFMDIHILPPWWKSWWAYLVYIIIALALIWIIRREELNRLNLKNRLKLESFESSKLKEVDRLKSRFFTNISHEFRTPLTLLLGPLNDFSKDHNVKSLTQFVPEMQRNAKRLLQLINQLLDLSKLDASHYSVNTSREDIISFVKQIVHSFSSLAHRKNIEIETSVDPRLREKLSNEGIHFYFDGDIVEKILTNLLSNAFKFTPSEGSIIVSLILSEKEKDFLELKVEDTGTGIPPEKLPFIFDRFYQADDSNVRQFEGSGIGLALAKELTKLHKGKIMASSLPGKGAVIICYLPFNKKIISENKKMLPAEIQKNPLPDFEEDLLNKDEKENDKQGSPMVLVVEDQQDMRKYILEKLADTYKVIEARDGKEGLEKAIREIPDLVVSDVMMPLMDGFELCKLLKTDNRTSHIPVILLTARAEDSDKLTGLGSGADAYLIKPFNAQELIIRVHHLITVRNKMRIKFSDKLIIKPAEITVTPRDKEFVQKLTYVVETHIGDPKFSIDQLSTEMTMSASQLNRKLKALINQSPQKFIRSFRMQRALELLKTNSYSVAEAAWKTGFEDQGYFSKVFKNYFGCLPSEKERFPKH